MGFLRRIFGPKRGPGKGSVMRPAGSGPVKPLTRPVVRPEPPVEKVSLEKPTDLTGRLKESTRMGGGSGERAMIIKNDVLQEIQAEIDALNRKMDQDRRNGIPPDPLDYEKQRVLIGMKRRLEGGNI